MPPLSHFVAGTDSQYRVAGGRGREKETGEETAAHVTFPHIFVPAQWERRVTGHMGFTYLTWTFVDLTKAQVRLPVHDGFRRHEQRHVQQSVTVTFLCGALIYGLTWVLGWSHLWVFAALLTWPLVYFAASVYAKFTTGKGYTDNVWERDAFRYEERTR